MTSTSGIQKYWPYIACAVIAVAAVLAYQPGLSGPFMLDDYSVLSALGNNGGVTNWEAFKSYITEGYGGPTGRPVSMLSFLIDGNNWPAETFPFKRTNLVIHLLNGLFIGLIMRHLLSVLGWAERDATWVAIVAAACWLLHPFMVSTTLYVVQRMAQLATFFVLLGMGGYLYGRSMLASDTRKAYLIMSASIALGTLLAMLSKENGILLPLLVAVIELTIFASRSDQPQLDRRWAAVFLLLPVLGVAALLGRQFFRPDFFDVVPPREFSLWERTLTEARIVADYLQNLLIPKLYTTGVFQDHFIKSTGILSPVSTLLTLLLHAALITFAFLRRRTVPLLAFAILFFYGAHLIESTTLNLELYFEHRNYLAAAFLFLPIIAFLYEKVRPQMFAAVAVLVCLLLAGFTHYSATVWHSLPTLVEASARKAPTSARAQVRYALLLFNAQRYDEALQTLNNVLEAVPGRPPLVVVNRTTMLCKLGLLNNTELQGLRADQSKVPYDSRMLGPYTLLLEEVSGARCPDVDLDDLRPLFVDMLDDSQPLEEKPLENSHVLYLTGYTDALRGDADTALDEFTRSLALNPGADKALTMAQIMATQGQYESALTLADIALETLGERGRTLQRGTPVTAAEVEAFQRVVRADLDAERAADSVRPDP